MKQLIGPYRSCLKIWCYIRRAFSTIAEPAVIATVQVPSWQYMCIQSCIAVCRVKLQTQEVVDGQIRENVIVTAATYALENTAVTLTYMLTPPLLKCVVWPLVQRFPSQRLQGLNIARMQLYTAALTLTHNAMKRLGLPLNDELQMARHFGECCYTVWLLLALLLGTSSAIVCELCCQQHSLHSAVLASMHQA